MKQRAMVMLFGLGAAVAGILSVGLVNAADRGSDLGEPVVVSPSPSGSPDRSQSPSPGRSQSGDAAHAPEKTESKRPTPRKTKAEPVKPPSPRPGGGDDDGSDDDDDGGDDDDDD
ncbi:hypothetical protein [Nonomuraea turcica]|uniref:hypothetical protein n=1 Tax=Nonomuraea sp. G32 TaxID=3067274 RepID=UPI00273C1181|nr:hypothetical protein [Nonomuraea sp. G32]MDP4511063.1 hypothetical protein [Nonomuraea sp. G32]